MMTRPLSFSVLASLFGLLAAPIASAQEPTAPAPVPSSSSQSTLPDSTSKPAPVEEAAPPSSPETPNEAEPPPPEAGTTPAPTEESARVLPPPPAGSGGIAVFPVAATNLTEGESAALGALFASELSEEKGGRVLHPATVSQYASVAPNQASAASHMKVEQYVTVEAIRLDRTTIVAATLRNQDGSIVRSAKMAAKSVDDFQFVAERLVVALLQGKPVEETRTLDNVTTEEAEGRNRVFVEKVFGFKTSFAVPYSAKIELPPMVGASFNGRLEAKKYFLEFGGGLLLPATSYDSGEGSGYGGVFAEVGGSYYLTQTNISPYVGAGVTPRILSSQPANLAVHGQAGVMFFRTSSSRLYAELRVAQNLTPMEVFDRSYVEDTDLYDEVKVQAWPIEFGVNVGLGW